MLAATLALVLVAAPAADPNLLAARAQIAALQYDKAEASLAKVLATPRLDLAVRLEGLQLQGEVKAFVGKAEESTRAFEELLYLQPGAAPDPNWSPKVSDRFKEAQAWLQQNPPLSAEPGAPRVEHGKVVAVSLQLHDGQKRVKSVTVVVGTRAQSLPAPADGKLVAPVPPAPEVTWWAQLLADDGAVLARVGTPEKPIVAQAPAPALELSAAPPAPSSGLRTAGYAVGAAGVASVIGGGIFATLASSDRSTLRGVARDGQGRITGLSQVDYASLYDRANSRATTALILGGLGAAAIAGGAALWIAGRPVTVTPTAHGAAVVGSLP